MDVDRAILTEALSAIMGVLVSDRKHLDEAAELQVTDLPALSFLNRKAFTLQRESYLVNHMAKMICGGPIKSPRNQLVIPDDFFDPAFDFDFSNMSESKSDFQCMRGDELYKRPYGWMRFALKVWDKYPDGNDWLGTGGWRNSSSPGEWPVSYHGTGKEGAEGIIQSNFKAGDRMVYGRGIYSTPDIKVAEGYATSKTFTSQKNGKTYQVIMQNRINPSEREIKASDIWLIPIPEDSSLEEQRDIVQRSIRPYGLLLKRV